MKKYLMTGIAVLAMCAGFTSCSHDLEAPSQEEINEVNAQKITNSYNQAFIATFGQPAANQNWGFGTATRAAGSGTITQNGETVNYTLAEQNPSSPTPPAQPGSSATAPSFRTTTPSVPTTISFSVPEGTVAAPQNLSNDGVYTLSNDYNVSNPQNQKNVTFYVIGDNVVYKEQTHNDGTTFIVTEGKKLTLGAQGNYIGLSIYLAKNATLVLEKENGTVNLKDAVTNQNPLTTLGAMLYLGENSSVICKSNVEFEQYFTIYNEKGTIDAKTNNKQISINGGALIYNAKELKAANIKMLNESAELINVGNIEASEFDMRSGGKFLNEENGKVTIAGTNWIDNMNSVWQNKGDFTCGDFHIENTRNVFNNCKLTVTANGTSGTGTFSFVKNSTLVLDGNNSVKADAMSWGPDCDFYMSNNSMLWVVGALTSTSANKGYGVHGVGSGYSILKAGSITYSGDADQSRMNYFGNVYVDTETHFAQGFKDQKTVESSQPYYYFDSSVKFRFRNDECPITSTISGNCHHGYTPPTPPTEVADLRIMAEDLSATEASDFDFNDVVFDVYFAKEGESETKILVRAAGGTLPLQIKVSDTEWQEVHGLWGLGTGIMINTGAEAMFGSSKGADGRGSKELTLKYPIRNAEQAKNITIQVQKALPNGQKQWMEMTAPTGEPAAKFAIPAPNPDSENWCNERTPIQTKYTKFTDWVQGQSNIKWWLGTAQ